MQKEKQKTGHKRTFFTFLIRTGIIIGIIYLLITYVLVPYRESGNEMSPYIRDGDLCFFYKLDYLKAGDVILYKNKSGELRCGRIKATEGEKIEFPEEGGYLIDGYVPNEEIPYETYKAEEGITFPITVGKNQYFVLNDFRTITTDSREEGCIEKKQIVGKLLFMFRRRNF